MIFDTHTHLNVEEFAGREAEEIALAAEMGVTQMNIVDRSRDLYGGSRGLLVG